MLKALKGSVIVSRGDLNRNAHGDQLAPGSSGLVYGRDVDVPWATVIASSATGLALGQRVIMQPDLGDEVQWQGMRVERLDVDQRDPRTKEPKAAVLALFERDDERPDWPYRDPPHRTVLRLVPPEDSEDSPIVGSRRAHDDGHERGVDRQGRLTLVPKRVGNRWADEHGAWCSVRETEVAAVA